MTSLHSLAPGHHFLRFTNQTPLQIGGGGGSAMVDRPLPLDSWSGLPYLPFSALKGVFAGRLGNPLLGAAGTPNQPRFRVFGSADSVNGPGRPGTVELGDADLLSFPIGLRGGGMAQVVPVKAAQRLAVLGLGAFVDCPSLGSDREALAGPGLIEQLPRTVVAASAPDRARVLSKIAHFIGAQAPVVLAAPNAARRLWRSAVEVRTMTSLASNFGHSSKRVVPGTLRRVELIPAGSQFISAVTATASTQVDLGAGWPVQLGAWEGWGCGFVVVDEFADVPSLGAAEGTEEATDSALSEPRDADLMVLAFERWATVPEGERGRVRSLAREAGTRLRNNRSASLAFWLAKAKLLKPGQVSAEVQANRRLLRLLFDPELDSAQLSSHVESVIAGIHPAPGLESLCRWLSRFSEGA
jgi:hypothetical protein